MKILNTTQPYKVIPYEGIQYNVCRDYSHISRYKGLRQIVHNPHTAEDRFIALETPNPFHTSAEVIYYQVPAIEENRLDLIALKHLGSARYGWVIAYFNNIEDGFTVREGQRICIPKTLTSLFSKHELLASVSPYSLNLGSE